MADTAIIVGGTQGLGLELAKMLNARGDQVYITGRDKARAEAVAKTVGPNVKGLGFDISQPHTIAAALAEVKDVRHVVIGAIERDKNTVREYNIDKAIHLATMKLVGYTEVVHSLLPRMTKNASILLMGGLAKERPYPGSATVTAVNGALSAMVKSFVVELAPIRTNAIHPGIIGDSPAWEANEEFLKIPRARTPIGRLVTMAEIADAMRFLLDNEGVNGINLAVDGGWLIG